MLERTLNEFKGRRIQAKISLKQPHLKHEITKFVEKNLIL